MEVSEFLLELNNYKNDLDINLIEKACLFAEKAHLGQYRQSQNPYITHPLSVAYELIKYSFDSHIICAGILHDVIEDTDISANDIKENFGEDILNLVVGVTKLSKYKFATKEEANIENFRKFILAVIDDIRVLIIKLFDRLDNIRTIEYIPKDLKRRRIAKETLDIYAPLAQRLSLNKIKDELEDCSFKVIEPSFRDIIIKKTQWLQESSFTYMEETKNHLSTILKNSGASNFIIYGRIKTPYSIWSKMRRKKVIFDDMTDVIAFRIIVDDIPACYKTLGVIHGEYKAIFSRFKDYISYPKPNNYQSIHTCVLLDNAKKVEFQIRNHEMDNFAENGIAAHWNYKNPTKNKNEIMQYSWLKKLGDILTSKDIPIEDVYEYSKMEIFTSEVFVLTPKGEIVSLPKGSTALDFAYQIHSEVGNHCGSVIINGHYKPLFSVLNNGDKVEVIDDDTQEPQTYWLSFVKTTNAKLSIKRYINQKHKKDISEQALSIISYEFEKENLIFHKELLSKVIDILKIKSESLLFEKVLEGSIEIDKIINALYPQIKTKSETIYNNSVEVKDFEVKGVSFAECCYPVFGDKIIGVLFPSNKIEVHHTDCDIISVHLNNLNKADVVWSKSPQDNLKYKVKLKIKLKDVVGALLSVTEIMYKSNVSIYSIESEHYFLIKDKFRAVIAVVSIKDKEALEDLIINLSSSFYVLEIKRLIN